MTETINEFLTTEHRLWIAASINSGGVYSIDEVFDFIEAGKLDLYQDERCAIVYGKETHYLGDVLVIMFAGGDVKALVEAEKKLEKLAKDMGFYAIMLHGRPGWSKQLKDYKVHAIIMQKVL